MSIAERRKVRRYLAWRIIQSSANDNRTSLFFWLRHLLPWSLFIGLILAWLFFVR